MRGLSDFLDVYLILDSHHSASALSVFPPIGFYIFQWCSFIETLVGGVLVVGCVGGERDRERKMMV
jgi:hypothetical protein